MSIAPKPDPADYPDVGTYCSALLEHIKMLEIAHEAAKGALIKVHTDEVNRVTDELDQLRVDFRDLKTELQGTLDGRLGDNRALETTLKENLNLRELCINLAEDLPHTLVHFIRWQKEQHNARFVNARDERVAVGTADALAFCKAHGYLRESGLLEAEDEAPEEDSDGSGNQPGAPY